MRTPPTGEGLRHPWLLVARREVATKLADRTFLIGTLLTLALILAFVVVQAVWSERTQTYDVAATASAAPMAVAVADQAPTLDDGLRVTVVPAADDAAAEAALLDEEADAWLTTRAGSWGPVARAGARGTSGPWPRASCVTPCSPRTPLPQGPPSTP